MKFRISSELKCAKECHQKSCTSTQTFNNRGQKLLFFISESQSEDWNSHGPASIKKTIYRIMKELTAVFNGDKYLLCKTTLLHFETFLYRSRDVLLQIKFDETVYTCLKTLSNQNFQLVWEVKQGLAKFHKMKSILVSTFDMLYYLTVYKNT